MCIMLYTPTLLQLYSTNLWFYVLFFIVHVTVTFVVTVEIYYRWQISVKESFIQLFKILMRRICVLCNKMCNCTVCTEERVWHPNTNNKQSIIQLFEMYKMEGVWPPKHKVI